MRHEAFARRLRESRAFLGITREELSVKLGLPLQVIYMWEIGYKAPSCSILPGLCKALGVSSDFLLGISNNSARHVEPSPKTKAKRKNKGRSFAALTMQVIRYAPWIWKLYLYFKHPDLYASKLRIMK